MTGPGVARLSRDDQPHRDANRSYPRGQGIWRSLGHPAFFFHGLIGSHHQAAYIGEQARQLGLRVITPDRPGVGQSQFVKRQSALEVAAHDMEDLAAALDVDRFSVIGISGGTPYALACLDRLPSRVRTTTIISGMGSSRTARHGSHRRMGVEIGSRYPGLAKRARRWGERLRARRVFCSR